MSKVTLVLLFGALAGCASAPRVSTLRVDATNESTFAASVAAIQQNLRPDLRLRLSIALKEIWSATESEAQARNNPDETYARYLARLNGLAYKQIVSIAGPDAERKYNNLLAKQLVAEKSNRLANAAANPGFSDPGVGGGRSGESPNLGQFPAWIAY